MSAELEPDASSNAPPNTPETTTILRDQLLANFAESITSFRRFPFGEPRSEAISRTSSAMLQDLSEELKLIGQTAGNKLQNQTLARFVLEADYKSRIDVWNKALPGTDIETDLPDDMFYVIDEGFAEDEDESDHIAEGSEVKKDYETWLEDILAQYKELLAADNTMFKDWANQKVKNFGRRAVKYTAVAGIAFSLGRVSGITSRAPQKIIRRKT